MLGDPGPRGGGDEGIAVPTSADSMTESELLRLFFEESPLAEGISLARKAGEAQGRPPRLRVRPRVADVLERPLAPALRFVEARLGQRVEVIRVEADDVTDFEVG